MIKPLFFALTLLVIALVAATWLGIRHQNAKTNSLTAELEQMSQAPAAIVNFAALSTLPVPVRRYFQNVLTDGRPMLRTVRLEQKGRLKISPEAAEWSAFYARQSVSAQTPGFVWDARIKVAPMAHVRVRDAYVGGKASGEVSLLSLIPLGSDSHKPELDAGALYRYLAEAVWYPTALLPASGVQWLAVDDNRAVATLRVQDAVASLEFRFNDAGEVTGVYTTERYGLFNGRYEQHPWEGRFSDYQRVGGMKIPMQGEVGWHLPGGWWLFWQGSVTRVDYSLPSS